MSDITFTMMQRLQLDGLLGIQRGTLDDIEVFSDIREKIKVSEDARAELVRELPDGRLLIDLPAVAKQESTVVTLEKEERRRLLNLLKTTNTFTTQDIEWVRPLCKQLES